MQQRNDVLSDGLTPKGSLILSTVEVVPGVGRSNGGSAPVNGFTHWIQCSIESNTAPVLPDSVNSR